MIMRVFQVTTHAGKDGEFARFFRETTIPLMKRTPGVVSVTPGTARRESPTEFCFVMVWDSLESLKAFVGDDYRNAHVDPAEAGLVRSRSIHHYDVVED